MQSIDLIRENLQRSEEIALSRIEEMADHCLVPPTPRGGAHTLWVLGHLSYIEGLVIHQFMLGESNPLAAWQEVFDGEEVSNDPDDYVFDGSAITFDRALAESRSARASTIELLDSLNENDLDRPAADAPAAARELFGTYRKCFQSCADHWFMHRGQLADARRAAGLQRMWF